jgi:hypothetical protein
VQIQRALQSRQPANQLGQCLGGQRDREAGRYALAIDTSWKVKLSRNCLGTPMVDGVASIASRMVEGSPSSAYP